MPGSEILGIVAIALALAGIVATVVYGRRVLKPPRRLLLWHSEIKPVVLQELANYGLTEFVVNGVSVQKPYLIKLVLTNSSDLDIESSTFDQGRPVKFPVSEGDIITFADPEAKLPNHHVDHSSITIGPDFLQARSTWSVSFITDGAPK